MRTNDVATLLDWKRRIFELYAAIRSSDDPASAWQLWRGERDRLFREHPQSPLPEDERAGFHGLHYFDYDPAYRVKSKLGETQSRSYEIATSGEEPMRFDRVAVLHFELRGEPVELEAYWLTSYGGGLFLPFADATSGALTYGAGRYLLDTVKGADLGESAGEVVLDFNFAYNPSCSYDPRWVCPLATPANRLSVPVEGGERNPG